MSSEGRTMRRSRNSEVETADKAPSPQPFLRSSRRLRQQRNRSIASPPLQSPSSTDAPRSPLPPSPPSGVRPRPRRSSQTNASSGGGSSMQQQRSLRRKRNNVQEETQASPVPEKDYMFDSQMSQDVEEMDSPSDEEDRQKEDEMSDSELGAKKRARLDGSEADKNVISSPGMQSPEQQRSVPPSSSRDEENYTICHGTPTNKVANNDISSPKSWSHHHHQQQQQQQQQQQHLQQQYQHQHHHHQQQQHHQHQQMQQYAAAAAAAAAAQAAQAQQHQQHRPPTTPSSDAVTFSPPMGQIHPGSSSSPVGGQFDHHHSAAAAAGGHALTAGGVGLSGGRNIQADYAHRHHLVSAEHAHHRDPNSGWSAAAAAAAGLHPQFASVPGGYPPMYGPAAIPGMHYSGQPVPSANYPYPMPYHWGHHPSAAAAAQFGAHGEHMIQQQQQQQQQQQHHQQQHRQAATSSKDMPTHHDVLQHPRVESMAHVGSHTPAESPQATSLHLRGHATASPSTQSINVTSSSAGIGKPSSRGHYPSPPAPLHQLTSPGGAPHTLSHQLPHGTEHLPPGAHQAATAAFPYGFDSGAHSLSQMHMWQQSQMQSPQIRPLPGVPPHHLPPHMAPRGLWYPPQHMAAHQMLPSVGEITGHPAQSKKAGKGGSKSVASVDGDKNRNTNNNNAQPLNMNGNHQRLGPTQEFINAATYKSSVSYPSSGVAFSIENLAAPYNVTHLVGVSASPHAPPPAPPPPPPQAQRFNNPEDGSLPVSMILERTRQNS